MNTQVLGGCKDNQKFMFCAFSYDLNDTWQENVPPKWQSILSAPYKTELNPWIFSNIYHIHEFLSQQEEQQKTHPSRPTKTLFLRLSKPTVGWQN